MTATIVKQLQIAIKPCGSSQIAGYGYDEASRTLAIEFRGKGDAPGSLYHYFNFEPERYAELEAAESKGSFFYQHIRPNTAKYPYQRQVVKADKSA